VAKPLGLSVSDAAFGIHRLVGSNMAEAARMHAAERGLDLTEHVLIAFGGAGPVHAWSVARQLRIPRVVFPAHSGVLSAFGFLAAPPAFETARSRTQPLEELSERETEQLLEELAKAARAQLKGTGKGEITALASADMRYRGQGSEVRVGVPGLRVTREGLAASFEKEYASLYGRAVVGVPIEVVTWRVRAERPRPAVSLFDEARVLDTRVRVTEPKRRRLAWLPDADGPSDVPVFRRADLVPGMHWRGPALIEDVDSTLVLARGTCRVLVGGAVLAEVEA
jgi:N-methylhydantoinase A